MESVSCLHVSQKKSQKNGLFLGIFRHGGGGLLVLRGSVRRGASSGGANQLASQSAAISKQQQLPMVQQNQDPFCYSTFRIQEHLLNCRGLLIDPKAM